MKINDAMKTYRLPNPTTPEVEKPMPLLKKRSLVNRITDFIRKHSEKYE